MNSIENHLTSLIPTLAGPLPPELIQLATSLVAQSKNRISNLKPNEEICREYVCAHIACDPPALRASIHTLCTALGAPGAHRHVIAGTTSMLSEPSTAASVQRSHLPLITAITLLTIERLLPEGKNVTVGAAGKWKRGEGYIMKRDGVMGALGGGVGKAGFSKEDTDGWVKELSRRGIRELPWLKEVPDGVGLKVRAGDKVEVELVVGTVKKGRKTAVRKPAAAKKKKDEDAAAEVGVEAEVQGGEEAGVVGVVEEGETVQVPVPVQKKVQTRAARPRQKTAAAAAVAMPPAKRQKVEKVESGIGSFMQGAVDYLSENKRRTYKTWEARMVATAAEVEKEGGLPSQQQQAAVVGG
ncbi:hypothetical protein P167DRAFT_607138 [Morchella conica CCBAS932]|uniref:ORC6 first cyclin-like domain-containing protein n=1 Tax=Morchella conica CCBAS932 TaxID=1392247 RepID=A0A3N4KJ70_9PEZI|nr:hypothetical protein P167DRAFT_607138 [Morchella conica CCBAS932]